MGGITAVSRRKESMSVFQVTSSGSIDAMNWEESRGWYYWQTYPAGSAAIHTKLVSLTRHSENVELF